MTCDLRIGEVLALRARDLDLDDQTVTVAGTVAKVGGTGRRSRVVQQPKTRASLRTLSLLPDTVPELRAWRRTRGQLARDALLFPDAFGKPLNDDVVRRIHKKATASIGRTRQPLGNETPSAPATRRTGESPHETTSTTFVGIGPLAMEARNPRSCVERAIKMA